MKNALQNKRGNSYVWLCVVVLVASMLFSVLFLYIGLTSQVTAQKRDVKAKLDGYVSSYAVDAFEGLKHGTDYADYLDRQSFADGVCPALGFADETQETYEYPNGACTMTRPEVTVTFDDGYGATIRYQVILPVRWNGITFADLTIPVTVSSFYKTK